MTTPPNLAQSMAEEIANEIVLHGSDGDLVERLSGATEIIQRRIEPLVKEQRKAVILLDRCLSQMDVDKMALSLTGELREEIAQFFSQIERKENDTK